MKGLEFATLVIHIVCTLVGRSLLSHASLVLNCCRLGCLQLLIGADSAKLSSQNLMKWQLRFEEAAFVWQK